MMIIYLYLSIMIIVSIITGIIVTVIEKKGLKPVDKQQEMKEDLIITKVFTPNFKYAETIGQSTNKTTIQSDKPKNQLEFTIEILEMNESIDEDANSTVHLNHENTKLQEDSNIPIIISSHTVDLGDVVKSIKETTETKNDRNQIKNIIEEII